MKKKIIILTAFLSLILTQSTLLLRAKVVSENDELFRWAADLASGVPSIFYSPNQPNEIIGFEKEIAEAIAKEIDRKPIFINNEWDGLIPGLKRNLYDVIINTMVVTPHREKIVDFSKTYYITYEQLIVNVDNDSINSLEDCRGKVVGTLKNSKAADILARYPEITVRLYNTELNFFTDLEHKRLDAAIIDAPIALYYAGTTEKLKLAGEPIDRIEYAVAVRKGREGFVLEINRAIERLIADGTFRRVLDRWNLWNDLSAKLYGDFSETNQKPVMYDMFMASQNEESGWKKEFKKYISFMPILGNGALMTIEISFLSMILAITLGFLLAVVRNYGPRPLSILAKLYIEFIRGTPLLIQLYFIFYGLPSIGIKLNPFMAGFIALGLNYSAYEAENYRAGLLSVPRGQMEAARALGMTHWQGIRYVVLPQAFRIMLPPVTNDFISLLKDSSLVSVITIIDLTFAYNLLATTYYNYFGIGIVVAFIYLLLGLPFVFLARWAEKRLSNGKKKRVQKI